MTASPGASDRLPLAVLTPEETLFQGEVLWVEIPIHDGLIGIWPGHAPLVASLSPGVARYATDGAMQTLEIRGGIVRVDAGRCYILMGTREAAPDGDRPNQGTLVANLESVLEEALSADDLDSVLQS